MEPDAALGAVVDAVVRMLVVTVDVEDARVVETVGRTVVDAVVATLEGRMLLVLVVGVDVDVLALVYKVVELEGLDVVDDVVLEVVDACMVVERTVVLDALVDVLAAVELAPPLTDTNMVALLAELPRASVTRPQK